MRDVEEEEEEEGLEEDTDLLVRLPGWWPRLCGQACGRGLGLVPLCALMLSGCPVLLGPVFLTVQCETSFL